MNPMQQPTATAPLDDEAIPYLPRGVRLQDDRVRGIRVLQAPERAMQLDPIGDAILSEMTGDITLGALIDLLAQKYAAPRDQIAEDVRGFLRGLMDRRMVFVRGIE